MPLSIENLEESDEDSCDVEENFSTKQLFSFAWQIAKGMVIIYLCFLVNVAGILILSITWKEEFRSPYFINMK